MVDPTGENLDPNKPATSSSSSRKRPFIENKYRAQQYEVAEIAKDRHPKALYRAAASKIGGDKAYVMRRMEEKPNLAKKLKKATIAIKKKKGTSLNICTSLIIRMTLSKKCFTIPNNINTNRYVLLT